VTSLNLEHFQIDASDKVVCWTVARSGLPFVTDDRTVLVATDERLLVQELRQDDFIDIQYHQLKSIALVGNRFDCCLIIERTNGIKLTVRSQTDLSDLVEVVRSVALKKRLSQQERPFFRLPNLLSRLGNRPQVVPAAHQSSIR
jgi:hypothetical protein